MSFFDDASLAFLPSGGAGKDGKAYSIKPTDGTGDFTFSRGTDLTATRVGPTGLIEKGRENILKQSNEFETTPWGSHLTDNTSGQIGYDGSSDAWLVECISNAQISGQNVSASGVQTISIYAKGSATNGIRIFAFGDNNVDFWFNLNTGLPDGAISTKVIAYNIEDVNGDGEWYRCSFTFIQNTTSIYFYITDNNRANATSGSIYIQDAQLEVGLAATDYIESGASTGKAGLLENEPRFDYSGGATCPSLLLEPQRVQLLPQTEYFDGYSNVGSTDEPNATTSPEGITNATFLKEDTSTGIHLLNQNTTEAAGVYTASVFAKANGRDWLYLNIAASGSYAASFNLSNGTTGTIQSNITSATIENYGNGWYRCSITADTTTAAVSPRIAIYMSTGDNVSSYTGDGTSGMYLYGFQIEAGSYPTSYIPNHSGGIATRTQDSIVSGLSQSLPLTAYIEIDVFSVSVYNQFQFRQDASNHVLRVGSQIRVGASALVTANTLGSNKFALSVDASGNFELFKNGTSLGTGTITETINEIRSDAAGYEIKQILVFPEALSDADCITLTT